MKVREIISETERSGYASISLRDVDLDTIVSYFRISIGIITSSLLRLRDVGEARPNSLSYIYGKGGFPLHTDFAFKPTPPRFVMLANQSNDAYQVDTLVSLIRGVSPNAIKFLEGSRWIVKTPHGPCVVHGKFVRGDLAGYRWDTEFLTPWDDETARGILAFGEALEENAAAIHWGPMQAVVIDNWMAVHGRGSGEVSPLPDEHRSLQRIEVWPYARVDI